MDESGPDSPLQAVERYVANPILRVVLRTPLARLVGEHLLLLSYEGRHSGERYRTPVSYQRDDGDLVVSTFREAGTWWHNFEDGHPATLWLSGTPVAATGRALTDEGAVADWLETLVARDARILSLYDVPEDPDASDLRAVAGDLVVVRFTLE